MRIMRALRRGIIVIAGVLVIALVAVWLNLSRIVKSTVQSEGTKSLRLSTTLDSALVSIFTGKLGLHGLGIASPKNFSAPHMLEARKIAVDVTFPQLRRNPVHVSALRIDKPRLVIEQSGGALNFRKAMELLPASDPDKPPMKLVIDQLEMKDAEVVIRPGLPGLQQEVIVQVPALSLRNVGSGKGAQNGAAIKEVAMRVISALAAKAAESDQLPAELKALLHLDAGQIAAKLGGEAIRNVTSQVPGEVGKVLQGVIPQGRTPRPPDR